MQKMEGGFIAMEVYFCCWFKTSTEMGFCTGVTDSREVDETLIRKIESNAAREISDTGHPRLLSVQPLECKSRDKSRVLLIYFWEDARGEWGFSNAVGTFSSIHSYSAVQNLEARLCEGRDFTLCKIVRWLRL